MPYIKKEARPGVDSVIVPLLKHLQSLPMEEQDGALNYTITRLVRGLYPTRYFHLNRALGVLSAVAHELYRRVIAPYEDTKIKENGDVT